MQETIEQPTLAPEAPEGLAASALQAEAWAGEPFLHPDEDPAVSLAPETARRHGARPAGPGAAPAAGGEPRGRAAGGAVSPATPRPVLQQCVLRLRARV